VPAFIELIEFRRHLKKLIVFSVCFIVFITAIYIRYSQLSIYKVVEREHTNLQLQHEESSNAVLTLNEMMPLYQDYQHRGLISRADRLNWIETLDSISTSLKIPDVQFTLENTYLIQEGESSIYHYEIPVYASDMHLSLSLLHEGDLYQLFSQLQNRSFGSFSVESCETRTNGDTEARILTDGLKAKCHLRWFNINDLTKNWENG